MYMYLSKVKKKNQNTEKTWLVRGKLLEIFIFFSLCLF